MKLIYSCNNFSYLSGSPLYVFTLAREMVLLGNDVTIYSPILGGIVTSKAREAGIRVLDFLPDEKFDVMHLQQRESIALLNKYDCPAVYTIHSEFPCEDPLRDSRINRYIAIRPTIAEKWGIDCDIIYNPIDFERFHPFPKPEEELVLFVGTIDNLRRKSAEHLMKECLSNGKKCRFVGQKFANWADGLDNWFDSTWDIEEHLKDATETAGIMLGRTTLEGYACGLPSIIYDVDLDGNIKSITRNEVPDDMERFDSKIVAQKILKIYNEVSKM